LTQKKPYGKNAGRLTTEYPWKTAAESLLGEITRRRFLSAKKVLIPKWEKIELISGCLRSSPQTSFSLPKNRRPKNW
jgi:hypothetical protein